MQLDQQLFKKHFKEYVDYCNRSQWLAYNESYKFHFGRWLNERVDFGKQSDEEILEICKESQNQVYHEGWPKGVNFIVSAKRFRDEFITLGDVQILRKLWKSGEDLPEEAINNRSMSFPKLSVWAGVLIPEKYKILANEQLMNGISFLFNLSDYPKSGFKGFQFSNSALTELSDAIESEFSEECDQLIRIALPGIDKIKMVDRVWLVQDFILFLSKRVLDQSQKYFWINHEDVFEDDKKKGVIAATDKSIFHHQSLKEMKEGDWIVHHANQGIVAYSRVQQEFQIKSDPDSTGENKIVVGVNYFELDNPLSDEALKEVLSNNIDLLPKSQSPINKNLNVAQGYCYPINKDLFNQLINSDLSEKAFNKERNSTTIMKEPFTPLNQILYGPPGTGKTYHTVNRALEIIHGPDFYPGKTRPEFLNEFNRLKEEGRIGFVTFHQSFSYEDFVEGITPKLVGNDDETQFEDGEIKYKLTEGIFKKLCRMARGIPSEKIKDENQYDFENARYFKMSLGGRQNPHIHDWCIKNKKIALGWGSDEDFHDLMDYVGNWPEFRDRFKDTYPHLVKESRFHIQAMHAFLKMKKGDVVLVSKGNYVVDAVGVIKDDEYIYDDQQDFGYYQFRKVEWLASDLNASPDLFVSKNLSQQTVYEFYDVDIKKEYFKKTFNRNNSISIPENYVLIIDEINRGNIAAIFGELITLIEGDKRQGSPEALETLLPYSKEWFGVPSNLHIIGTMNTADRSVEALDTALRRRFAFEEMLPKPELLSPQNFLFRLLWDYWDLEWDDPDYADLEESLCLLLGVDDSFHEKKYTIWEQMETEGFNISQTDKFDAFAFSGLNLAEVLQTINNRIEALVDRDHTIGHSYFMNVKSENDLRMVFKDKIVPLLQEYFFGDFGKIGLVMGPAFVEKVPEEVQFAQIEGYEDIAHLQDERFRLKTITGDFPVKKAVSLLLNKEAHWE
ncbi:MAG: AAA family ATPase [Bacteroidales bacterium]